MLVGKNRNPYICTAKSNGFLAQLVEQRTENPCVPGSIPGETTKSPQFGGLFLLFCSLSVLLCFSETLFYLFFCVFVIPKRYPFFRQILV